MIQRLSNNVIKLVANNASPMTNTGTNCYLVGSGAERILIDTGSPDEGSCLAAMSKFISDNKRFEITKIICTHWHPDHTGGITSLRAHNTTKNCLFYKHPRIKYSVGREYPNAGEKLPSGASYEMDTHSWINLADEEEIKIDDVSLKVLFTPGHADDHICLWLEDESGSEKVLFSGDNILGGSTAVFDNYFDYMKSLLRLRNFLILKSNAQIYPGHGEVIPDGLEMVNYYIQHRLQRENQIISHLSLTEPKTIAELVNLIYVDLNPMLIPAASINVLMTLDKLLFESKVVEIDDKWKLT